mmetsp:Transcript_26484/g.52754  ORF Transcript_26484/g.52754 Transcript_26484/m.52754 type:complete len:101 (-) Transcript_26484:923-1225(-)
MALDKLCIKNRKISHKKNVTSVRLSPQFYLCGSIPKNARLISIGCTNGGERDHCACHKTGTVIPPWQIGSLPKVVPVSDKSISLLGPVNTDRTVQKGSFC